MLTYPTGRTRSTAERVAVVAGYVAAVITPAWGNERLAIVLGVLLVAFAMRPPSGSVARDRRARRRTVWVADAVGIVVMAGAAARLVTSDDVVRVASQRAYEAVLVAAALALAAGVVSRSSESGAAADLMVDIGNERSDRLRDGLARALGDPRIEVGYWAPDSQQYVDASGRPLRLPVETSDRAATMIGATNGPIGLLIHHPSLLNDPALIESIATATRLASVNARLRAEVRTQIVELEASRRRIVKAGDDERRRLEQRLRDGAERRLEALADRIEVARRRTGNCAATSAPLNKIQPSPKGSTSASERSKLTSRRSSRSSPCTRGPTSTAECSPSSPSCEPDLRLAERPQPPYSPRPQATETATGCQSSSRTSRNPSLMATSSS